MEKEEKDIELRCEEVQEILTRPPHALVRWGITVFFTVLALFFIGGCFFKYPDVVSAEITVTTEHPPVWIVARGNGKIKEVYGKDREQAGEKACKIRDNKLEKYYNMDFGKESMEHEFERNAMVIRLQSVEMCHL